MSNIGIAQSQITTKSSSGGGGGSVSSVFARTGVVTAQLGDYSFSLISGTITVAQLAGTVFGPSGVSHSIGAVPDPGGSSGTTRFLREDATWVVPATGAVTSVFGRTGAIAATPNDYNFNQLAGVAALNQGGTGIDLSTSGSSTGFLAQNSSHVISTRSIGFADISSLIFGASGGSHSVGIVPDPGASAGTIRFLREDSTWQAPSNPVTSVFGRTGVVVAATNDYSFSQISGAVSNAQLPSRTASINYVIDGGGAVPTTGVKGQINIPVGMTVKGWVLTADQSGSAVVDILRSTYAAFPSTSSIAGTDKPTLSSAQKNENLSISAWGSTTLNANDQLQFSLSSVTTIQRLNLTLIVTVPAG